MKTNAMFNHKKRGLLITKLMARDGDKCPFCKQLLDRHVKDEWSSFYITFDHIVPQSQGGTSHMDNLRLAHRWCNNDRGNGFVTFQRA